MCTGLKCRDCVCSPEDVAEGLPDAVLARVQREAGTPFDLAAGPLVRALLIQLAPEDCLLLLVMHHSVSDGWSFKVCNLQLTTVCSCILHEDQRTTQDMRGM